MLDMLKKRFEENPARHPETDWAYVEKRLRENPEAAAVLRRMEESSNGSPSKIMVPASGRSKKFRQRRKVVFPEPLGPRIAVTSPLFTSRSIPSSTVWVSKAFFTSRISSIMPVHLRNCSASSLPGAAARSGSCRRSGRSGLPPHTAPAAHTPAR